MYVCKSLQHAKENKSLKFCSVEPQKGNLLLHVQSGPYASFSMGEFNYIFIKLLLNVYKNDSNQYGRS